MPPKTRQTARTQTRRNASAPTAGQTNSRTRATRSPSPAVVPRTQTQRQSAPRRTPNLQTTQRLHFSSDDEDEQQINQTSSRRPTGKLMDSFSGMDPNIKVDDWLITFEVVTRQFTDEERQIALFRHVTGDAMTFAARELAPNLDNLSWTDIREQFQKRFGRPKHSHLLEAMDRDLKSNETIASYFDEKRRTMILANLDDKNQVDLLTRGITDQTMRSQIAAQRPANPHDWLTIALAIESVSNFNKSQSSDQNTHSNDSQTHLNHSERHDNRNGNQKQSTRPFNRPDFSKPPTTPCPVCKLFGFSELHWKKDCSKFKEMPNPQLTAQSSQANQTNPSQASSQPSVPTNSANHFTPLEFIHFDVLINGKPIRPFLDSGSTITAISKSAAERLNLKWNAELAIHVRTVDANTTTLGVIDSTIQINGNSFNIPVHVVENLAHDMLIGLDVAHSAGLIVDFGKQVKARIFGLQPIHATSQSNHLIQSTSHSESNSNSQHIIRHKPKPAPPNLPTHLNRALIKSLRERQPEISAFSLRKPMFIDGLIHIQFHGIARLVVPQSLVGLILDDFHGKQNHPGIRKTIRILKQRFWWPTLISDIKRHIHSCHVCQSKAPHFPSTSPSLPRKPFPFQNSSPFFHSTSPKTPGGIEAHLLHTSHDSPDLKSNQTQSKAQMSTIHKPFCSQFPEILCFTHFWKVPKT